MSQLEIGISGKRFIDAKGRHVILRGINLGSDCKLPYPDGGTDRPTDFSDHRTVSFVGRPFPLAEADEHLGRIKHWGFNALRFLVTWEAVEHEGPGQYDVEYIEYVREVCLRAQNFGLNLFIDFHQDVWSRMSGGSGAPCWIFEKLGLNYQAFNAAGAVHVMQYRYDYSNPERRQEDKYPTMSWPINYRMPVNCILWTSFFAGATLTPKWIIDGENVQDYLQNKYFGAVRALAQRLSDLDNVMGFDSLNEPGMGWLGEKLSERHPDITAKGHPGPNWTPLDGLRVARGMTTTLPVLRATAHSLHAGLVREADRQFNTAQVSIWNPGVQDPFEQAGAWRKDGDQAVVVNEDFFAMLDGRKINPEGDFLQPFFQKMAAAFREIRPDWFLFAEINPHVVGVGRTFPKEMPTNSINTSHWYDVGLLWSKRIDTEQDDAAKTKTRNRYGLELAYMRSLADRINGGSPTLIGEFGIPYDLNDGESFSRWGKGERGADVWKPQAVALELTYDAMDMLLLSSTQWNYTASNRNDLRIGDGWNQEDLSVFSRDQQTDPADPSSGGRAVEGFSRPYVQRAQGILKSMHFDPKEKRFVAEVDAAAEVSAPTEIYWPARLGKDLKVELSGVEAEWSYSLKDQRVHVQAKATGSFKISISAQ
ncbi:glycoside hydrolase family 5 protein [Stenotrophobium rhamnosiphilum]|uniref:Endoglucanase n=1 Tax=Stenotrophobium rhamnosiphilum TaxID=2029166 RepID=A0A2T5MD86_9GAMM|nr:cellulase family glycosylhydrolase [Stenotrophobium rhamnosiphilum]PTU30535.1 endoglucanase [Stenotrophobium rhamnosiphilum]